MALWTASALKATREAIDAKVEAESDAAVTQAIADAETLLYRTLGFKIEDTAASITLKGKGTPYLFPSTRIRTATTITDDGTTVVAADYQLDANGWILVHRTSSWTNTKDVVVTGSFGFVAGEQEYDLAKRAVLLMAVDHLAATKSTAGIPIPAGHRLTAYSSENADFTYAPATDSGFSPEVQRLIDAIGVMPTI